MSYIQAAEAVLASVGRPLTTHELTEEAIRQGLLKPGGKTPEASMSAALYTALQRNRSGRIVRLSEPGSTRARRGTVRWTLSEHERSS